MAAANSTFAERLNEAFKHRGITDTHERINRLTAATGRNPRTVARWLSGEAKPRGGKDIFISEDLRIDPLWLICGRGDSPWMVDVKEKLRQVPKEYLSGLTRYLLRLLNEDSKALRWAAMHERGEIGIQQILAMA